ncbi:MAG: ribbon-helix-helix protein, CopG family [Promethearchaeota archaeon]|nr:MAG: ribbon-helix-helix protein, CopG family [Candidatus Lokiarchaeota archaeon]
MYTKNTIKKYDIKMQNAQKNSKDKSKVLTVRVSEELDEVLEQRSRDRKLTKAAVIRDYLEFAKFFLKDSNSVKSLNQNDLIILKNQFFKSMLSEFKEKVQIEFGKEMGRFINDMARLQSRVDDISYKLDLCEKYGLFPKFIDNDGYILINKSFGPRRFVESFTWYLITMATEGDFNKEFTTEEIEDSRSTRKEYEKKINPVRRDATHYAFEFAKIETEKTEELEE